LEENYLFSFNFFFAAAVECEEREREIIRNGLRLRKKALKELNAGV
jgi:hypothetical protein